MALVTTLLRSRAATALASPHGVDHNLEQFNPMWAAHDVRARVVAVRRETDTPGACVATVTLQPTSTWRAPGRGVRPGRRRPAGHGSQADLMLLDLLAASLPGEQITLTVRAHDEGQVSRFLVHDACPGQLVHLSQAAGELTLHESAATPTNNRLGEALSLRRSSAAGWASASRAPLARRTAPSATS